MYDGFIKAACGLPVCTVADTDKNTNEIKKLIDLADTQKINLLVLPELCVTGYTCGDLFYSDKLKDAAKKALLSLAEYTKGKYPAVTVGVPLIYGFKLYNCTAVLSDGEILGIVPKTYLPNYSEFYEQRQFTSADFCGDGAFLNIDGKEIPFGTDIIFCHRDMPEYTFGIEICEDLWAASQPSEKLCRAGATVILNPSASNEIIGKSEYRRMLVGSTSARLLCGYVYTSSGSGESTQDLVYSGHCLIYENGSLLAESLPFEEKPLTISEIDLKKLAHERHKNTSFEPLGGIRRVIFGQKITETELTRRIERNPFVPSDKGDVSKRAEAILRIQSYGLKKRLEHTRAKIAVIGISGGLDSTLALLVTVRVTQAYENSQARERTQVLMDIANKTGGMVIGTGDLSELALGWATYNGDHMSMYAVNSSVPKTLVRYIVRHEAESSGEDLREVLYDILDTPVSPELLPADENGEIAQKTEDLVGPYELHDFFLYHILRLGERPKKIYRLALIAFDGIYDRETVKHWLTVFIRRFFSQQFKRSCLPDGPKVGSVTLSPRGDWRMPSDASPADWIAEVEML